MDRSLGAALDYIPRWLEFQLRHTESPGCVVAIGHKGRVIAEHAFGFADQPRGIALTPRHRFRVASHSKSFTSTAIMKLRERGRLTLDDRVGCYVAGLHPRVAETTIAQLLSHSAGLVRDGFDSGYWQDRKPFANVQQIRADLAVAPTIAASTRFKYSNHGFALAGFVIEQVAGESYASFVKREIVDAVGLAETRSDAPLARGTPLARGHSAKWPLGRRLAFPGNQSTRALAPATGFVSTAADLVRFFGQLAPDARASVLTASSRREMVRRHWRNPHASIEGYYGLGIISGKLGDWDWFGHAGGFPGYITRTCVLPGPGLTISVLTNAADGLAHFWLDGLMHIFTRFARDGAPQARVRDWAGRWWSLWGALDLVPVGHRVLVAMPALFNPFMDASELEVTERDRGRIALAAGYAVHGEQVRRVRAKSGRVTALWLAGNKLVGEADLRREMEQRYHGASARRR
ncbi:MAG: beta-lactamase family protein [Alphaproteobacteria bacterium]|nr:beta-lactamase family protein [Alphaproteobacteria bacterium]